MAETDFEKRCPTGIAGLDELLDGGFPRNRTILVRGSAGTGKTIFSAQFICNGASKFNEPGILVLLEQDPEEFRSDMADFNFDVQRLEEEKKLVLIDVSLSKLKLGGIFSDIPVSTESFSLLPGETTLDKLVNVVIGVSKKINAKRVVIDSLPALNIMAEKKIDARRMVLSMSYGLKNAGLTTLLTSEQESSFYSDVRTDIEKYVVDGVISMQYNITGPDAGRKLMIDKMRKTAHSEEIHPIKFVTGEGLQVLSE